MNRSEVLALTKVEIEPAVTVLLPVRRKALNHEAERLRASQLVDEACGLVKRSYPSERANEVVHRLHHVIEELDLAHPGDGWAMFVSPGEEHVFPVSFPVEEQLSIGAAFATRQLLVGLAREPRMRILALSEHQARLFEDHEGELMEVRRAGFPLSVTPPHEFDTPHRDFPIHEQASSEEHRFVYRAVDEALDELRTEAGMPIIVVGAERELAYFDEVSRHRPLIVGQVQGNYVDAGPATLERVVRPAIHRYVAGVEDDVVRAVLEGVGTGRVVTDFTVVWRASADGRGHRLVVERDYRRPSHEATGLTPGEEFDESGTLDHAVDRLIEHVMRFGGDVVFVDPGRLRDVGGIALELRY